MNITCNEEFGSRVYWDEDLSDDKNYHDEPFRWVTETAKMFPEFINTLLIFDGPTGKYFAKNYLPQSKLRCGYIPDCDINLYELPDKNIYVCIAGNYEKSLAGSIVEILQPIIRMANHVVGITFINHAELVNVNAEFFMGGTCIKSLSTDYSSPQNILSNITTLEAPNIIDGVLAGVNSMRQFYSKAATAYACFTNLMSTESTNFEPVIELLQKINIPLLSHENNFLTPTYS